MTKVTEQIALSKGYTPLEIEAALEYLQRKARKINPPGEFDSAGRFYAAERTSRVQQVRSPSRNFPYPEMKCARTAGHVAEVFNVDPLAVRRIARACELEDESKPASAHEMAELLVGLGKILKIRKR